MKRYIQVHFKEGENIQTPLELWESDQNTTSTFILANLLFKLHVSQSRNTHV